MSIKPLISIVTGTGAQGRSVTRAFLASGEWRVRILTRNKRGKLSQQLQSEGAELTEGILQDRSAIENLFEGASIVYSVTIPNWFDDDKHPMDEYEQGVMQADVAKEKGVKLFLFSTLPHVGKEFMGLGGVLLYDEKAAVNDYITSINLPAVYISTSVFLDNIHNWPLIRRLEGENRLEFWNYTVAGDKPVPFLWVERDLGKTVLALVRSFQNSMKPYHQHPLNHTIQSLASWRGTYSQIAREIRKQTGIETIHTIVPTVDERWHADLTKAFIYQDTHGLYPNDIFPPPTFVDLGVKFSTLTEFIQAKVAPMFRNSGLDTAST